jgi:hypothetical protein
VTLSSNSREEEVRRVLPAADCRSRRLPPPTLLGTNAAESIAAATNSSHCSSAVAGAGHKTSLKDERKTCEQQHALVKVCLGGQEQAACVIETVRALHSLTPHAAPAPYSTGKCKLPVKKSGTVKMGGSRCMMRRPGVSKLTGR